MEKISKEALLNTNFSLDDIYAVETCSRKIYFLGWTESAEHYNTVFARTRRGIELNINNIKEKGLERAILDSFGWNTPMSAVMGKNKNPVEVLMREFEEYENIFILQKQETGAFLESVEDGVYILVIKREM